MDTKKCARLPTTHECVYGMILIVGLAGLLTLILALLNIYAASLLTTPDCPWCAMSQCACFCDTSKITGQELKRQETSVYTYAVYQISLTSSNGTTAVCYDCHSILGESYVQNATDWNDQDWKTQRLRLDQLAPVNSTWSTSFYYQGTIGWSSSVFISEVDNRSFWQDCIYIGLVALGISILASFLYRRIRTYKNESIELSVQSLLP